MKVKLIALRRTEFEERTIEKGESVYLKDVKKITAIPNYNMTEIMLSDDVVGISNEHFSITKE